MRILLPLPRHDYDPSEVAVSWRTLRASGHDVRFATPDGAQALPDPLMLSGEGLDAWGLIPGLRKLRVLGLALRANAAARAAHDELLNDAAFRSEEHTSEPQSLMRSSYDVFCLNKKKT